MNSRKIGDIGLGAAIAWFTANAYTVAVPLTDTQAYDLIVEKDRRLFTVQVKYTNHKQPGSKRVSGTTPFHFHCDLSTTSRPRRGATKYQRVLMDKTFIDLLFVVTGTGTRYLIPVSSLTVSTHLKLSEKYDGFQVH